MKTGFHWNKRARLLASIGSAALATSLLAIGSATAQTEDGAEQQTDDDVIVIKGFRKSLADALDKKREANQVLDSISAEEIGKFSDFNVTDALARISGAQISRQSGEGETVNLRGLSSTFARVELDGRKVSATRDNNTPERGTVLTQFSTELFDNVEVIKSPKASDVEGGIGGIVRLNTPNPLDIGKLAFGAEASIYESDKYDFNQTNINGFASNVFLDGRLGILGSFVLRHDDNSLSRTTGRREPLPISDLADLDAYPELVPYADAYVPSRLGYEEIAGDEENFNINLKVQFQVTDDLELYAGGAYSYEDRTLINGWLKLEPEDAEVIPLTLVDPDATAPVIVNDEGAALKAALGNAQLDIQSDNGRLDNTLYNYNFGFKWNATDRLRAELDVAKSFSEEVREMIRLSGRTNGFSASYSYLEDPEFPVLSVVDYDDVIQDLLDSRFEELRKFDREIREEDMATRFDVDYDLDRWGISTFEVGVRYSTIETDRLRVLVRSPLRRNNSFLYGDLFDEVPLSNPVDNFFNGDVPAGAISDWPVVNGAEVWEIAEGISPAEGVGEFYNLDFAEPPRSTKEETIAYYGMANYDFDTDLFDIRGNFGVRVVNTTTTGEGAISIQQNYFETDGSGNLLNDAEPVSETESVTLASTPLDAESTSVLPSWNFVISRDEASDFLIRGAITRTETRPDYANIIPNLDLTENYVDGDLVLDIQQYDNGNVGPSSLTSGNPELEPYLAWNYDIGFEWYFRDNNEGLLTASYFYKDIDDVFFEDEAREVRVINFDGEEYTVGRSSQPLSGGDAVVSGLEVGFQTPFTFLPGFLSDFGMFANYTYLIDAEFTPVEFRRDDSGEVVLDTNGDPILDELEVQPFFDASEHTYNIAGYYERGGFSGRLAYNYRDEHRRASTEYVADFGRLDMSLRYRFENGIRLSFDALNLTEDERVTYHSFDAASEPTRSLITLRDYEPVVYQFGLAYTF